MSEMEQRSRAGALQALLVRAIREHRQIADQLQRDANEIATRYNTKCEVFTTENVDEL